MRCRAPLAVAACWLGLGTVPVAAQTYEIASWTVDGGGTVRAIAGAFTLSGTAGQPDAGNLGAAGRLGATGGFWAHPFLSFPPQADLAATKTNGQVTSVPGLPVLYTIVISNAGPAAVAGASVADALPAALTAASWTCAASPGSACPPSGTGSIEAVVDLATGGTATFSLSATLAPEATGTLSNEVVVAPPAGTLDPVAANNSAVDVDVLEPQADLSLAKVDDADPVFAKSPLTYTLSVANAGPSVSAGMTVVDVLPPGLSFVSSVPGTPACMHASGVVTCGLGALAPAEATTVTIVTAVHPGTEGILTNEAVVMGTQPDPVPTNDRDVETTTAEFRADGELGHGVVVRGGLQGVGAAFDVDDHRLSQDPRASYEIVLDEASGDVGVSTGPALERVAADGATVLQSSAPAGGGAARSLRFLNPTADTVADQRIRVRSRSCGQDCGPEDGYRLRAYETTGTIPRFNNSATQVTVVTLHNREPLPVSGRMYFWSVAGVLVFEEAFTLPPRGSMSRNTASVPALSGQSGSISVAHDGPYGALAGKAVALEPATGLSFDSPMVARPR